MVHYFTKEHEWIRIEEKLGTVGITPYAQHQLGDVVYVELPEIGKIVKKGDAVAVVESVKAASDVYSPISGRVVSINERLVNEPELVNSECEKEGWFFQIEGSNEEELETLLSQEDYAALIGPCAPKN